MSDPTPPLDDDLSALLDDEAAPNVAAMVENDPAAVARLAELRRARDAVSSMTVTPLDDEVIDRLVSTALDAAVEEVDPSAPVGNYPPGPITSLGEQRATRRQPLTWLVAAAVIVFVAIGVAFIWSGTQDSAPEKFALVGASINGDVGNDSAADAASPPNEAGKSDAPSTTMRAAAETGAGASAGALIDLGTFPSTDALRAHLKTSFPTSPTLSPADGAKFDSTTGHRCSDQAKALFSLDTEPSARGAAMVAGKRVVVFEFAYTTDDGRATTLIVAATPEACQPVLTFQR